MFSQRKWYTVEKSIQLTSLDEATRKAIWDVFYTFTKGNSEKCYDTARNISCSKGWLGYSLSEFEGLNPAKDGVYDRHYSIGNFRTILEQFINHEEWYRIFDVIELSIKVNFFLIGFFNKVFENEKVWYRISKIGEIIELTNTSELEEIDATLSLPNLSRNHFQNSISEFGKRKDSNYKLVAKEAIDGLEALLRDILWDEKIILWKAINKIQSDTKYQKYTLLFDWLDKLWAFANDQIRHAEKTEEWIIWFHDAKFILVLSSSIANYINSIR